jgi:hypothetical protein
MLLLLLEMLRCHADAAVTVPLHPGAAVRSRSCC